eukprot:gene27497-36281_t
MFKKDKDLQERSRALLKNKEVRNLRNHFLTEFPSVNEEQCAAVISSKTQVEIVKLANKTLLYFAPGDSGGISGASIPIFFDQDGRNNLYPTLHTLWRIPNALKTVTIHGPVSEFILRGADLMLPGITSTSPSFIKEKEKVAIKIAGNPLPFAVGECLIALSDSLINSTADKKGKAVAILHYYGDLLAHTVTPNSGFGSSVIYPVTGPADSLIGTEAETTAIPTQANSENVAVIDETDSKVGGTESEDDNLMRCLLLALKYVIKDKQLPMLASTFWSTVQRCSMVGDDSSEVQIKNTRFKKVSQFLSFCTSDECGRLLSIREENGVTMIASVQRAHELFKGAKVNDPEAFKAAVLNKDEDGMTKGTGKVAVVELLKLPKAMRDIFGSVRGEYGECLRPNEVRDVLVMFIKRHQLEYEADKALVRVSASTPLYAIISKSSAAVAVVEPAPQPQAQLQPLEEDSHGLDVSKMDLNEATDAPFDGDTLAEDDDEWDDGEDEDGEGEERDEYPPTTTSILGNVTGGVWMGGSSQSSDIQLKIHRDGLQPLDTDDGFHINLPPPPLPPSSVGVGATKSTWKPVYLPSPAAISSSSMATKSISEKIRIGREEKKKRKALGLGKKSSEAVDTGVNLTESSPAVLIRKDELFKLMMGKMTPYFAVVTPTGKYSLHSGQLPKIKIIDCQKRFACSVSLSAVPGVPQDKEVVVQGNFGSEIEDMLHKVWGIPRHLVDISHGKGVKAKKK